MLAYDTHRELSRIPAEVTDEILEFFNSAKVPSDCKNEETNENNEDDNDSDQDNPEWPIDVVFARRTHDTAGEQMLVKWSNFNWSECSWIERYILLPIIITASC